VINLQATDLNADPLIFRISALPAVGALYQYNAGVRGSAIASAGTVVNDSAGRVIFAPPLNQFGSPYASFDIIVNDGLVDSAQATVSVNIQNTRAFTHPASNIRPNAASLNGMVVPNSFATSAWFEWGVRGTYNQSTTPQDIGSGTQVVRVTEVISNLVECQTYQFRLVVSNQLGLSRGAPQLFSTGNRLAALRNNETGEVAMFAGQSNWVAMAAGVSHGLGLRSDGTIAVWGANDYGQTNVPTGLSNVVAIAGGYYHSIALKADGTVSAWGAGGQGQTSYPHLGQSIVPAGLTNVIAIAAGADHNLALRSDGTVVAWGYNGSGQTNVPAGLSNIVAVGAGYSHSLALRADGTVVAWGSNQYGQTNAPAGLADVTAITSGWDFNLALRTDETVMAWGRSDSGQTNVPAGASDVLSIASGSSHSLALKSDGTVIAWGYNYDGTSTVPPGLSNMVAVAAGGDHSLALGNAQPQAEDGFQYGGANHDLVIQVHSSDLNFDALQFRIVSLPTPGALYQFASGARGALITTADTVISDPSGRIIFVPAANAFASPYATFNWVATDGWLDSVPATTTINIQQSRPFTLTATRIRPTSATLNGLALPNGFDTTAWFEWGERGNFNNTTTVTPTGSGAAIVRLNANVNGLVTGGAYQFRVVVTNTNGKSVGATQYFTTGDHVTAWGENSSGQVAVPAGVTNVVAVSGGAAHSLALLNDGSMIGWGSNSYGQTNVPAGLSDIIAVAAGRSHNLALRGDGTVAVWGDNTYGQTNVPVGLTDVVGIAAGQYHSLALRSDGTVVAWGPDGLGQTNVPSGLNNVAAVAAGYDHSLAIKADGTLVAWGRGGPGQIGYGLYGQAVVPVDLNEVIAAAGGGSHTLVLKADGNVVVWGQHNYTSEGPPVGPVPVPPGFSNGVAVASGGYHSLALEADGTVVAWGVDTAGQIDVPVGLTKVVAIAAGGEHSLALGGRYRPQAVAQNVVGAANRDTLISLTGADPQSNSVSFRITSLPTAGKLYQYANGTRGAAINAADTWIPDAAGGGVIFAPTANGFGSPYATFTFVASSVSVDSLPAPVTINVLAPVAPFVSGFSRDGSGGFQIAFGGDSNTTYCVWTSTNLAFWEYLGIASQVLPGTFTFRDVSPLEASRFYRMSTACPPPVPRFTSYNKESTSFDVTFTGGPYWSYGLWGSTNLVQWEFLGFATETQAGSFHFLDTLPTNLPRRFYRVKAPWPSASASLFSDERPGAGHPWPGDRAWSFSTPSHLP
jgi:alpha-tubulin suppressor-like RCC1 family protein